MSTVLVPSLQVKERTLVRRRRELPIAGTILVAAGEQVSESQMVAEARLPGEMRIIRVAEELGIEAHEVESLLRAKEGDTVSASAVLAERSGFFGLLRSRVLSPMAGQVELFSRETGHLAVRAPSVPLQIPAYIRGTVVEVEADRAVVIESQASFIQGIFGIGGERCGRIRVLDIDPKEELTERHLAQASAGDILVGGCRPSEAALRAAGAAGISGLVVGSLDDRALSGYLGYELGIALTGDEKIPLTVIMTEGFGSLPIAVHALELFKKLDGKPASINGATQVRAGAVRPEIVIFSEGASNLDGAERPVRMQPGVRVRIIRVPFFGKYGEITEMPHELELLPTGGKARVLRVKLDSGESVTVPRANIELI